MLLFAQCHLAHWALYSFAVTNYCMQVSWQMLAYCVASLGFSDVSPATQERSGDPDSAHAVAQPEPHALRDSHLAEPLQLPQLQRQRWHAGPWL